MSLKAAQETYRKIGTISEEFLPRVRKPSDSEKKENEEFEK